MPASRQELPITCTYRAEDYARVQKGLIPQEMEDKWFIYCENDTLHIHRSWTGYQMYRIEFVVGEGGEATIKQCFVNRDQAQYQSVDDGYDAQLVCFLIDRLLLGRAVPFPVPGTVAKDEHPVYLHHIIGYGRSNGD